MEHYKSRKELKLLKESDLEKYDNALFSISKHNLVLARSYVDVYEYELFNSPVSSLKETSLYALLFKLRINKNEYFYKALEFLRNRNENFNVRSWSATGLASVDYSDSQKKIVLKDLFIIIDNSLEDIELRDTCLNNLLSIIGIPLRVVILRTLSMEDKQDVDDFHKKSIIFKKEIQDAKKELMID